MDSLKRAGIDPGKTGGWAIYRDNDLVAAGPVIFDDIKGLYAKLAGCHEIIIERAQGTRQMGASNSFEYGRSFGRLESIAILTGARVYYTAASWWKGKLNVSADKKLSHEHALRVIPGLKEFAQLQGDHGIAEAALMVQILLDQRLFEQLEENNLEAQKPKKKPVSYRL